jgi:hypothetical protein
MKSLELLKTLDLSQRVCEPGPSPNLQAASYFVFPEVYKTIFGRFLLLSFSKPQSVILLNVTIAIFDLVGRLSTYNGDIYITRLIYGLRPAQVNWMD